MYLKLIVIELKSTMDQKYKKIVMKFGGTSMADMDCISKVADHIERELSNGTLIAVVVSAMAGETDRLISLADQVGKNMQQSERDVIISTGEQVSSAILSMILNKRNIDARSIQGWQIPLITKGLHGSARISNVKSNHLENLMKNGIVPIIAGFQGISEENRVTTLGRGGLTQQQWQSLVVFMPIYAIYIQMSMEFTHQTQE